MQLPFHKEKTEKLSRDYSCAFAFGLSHLQIGVWTLANTKPQLVATSAQEKWSSDIDFVQAIDKGLTQALDKVGAAEDVNLSNLILSVPSTWIHEDKIIADKVELIRQACNKLELKPAGFVSSIESLANYLHMSEGVPTSAIVIGIWQADLEVSLIRMGRVEMIQQVKRSDDVVDDVIEGISRFINVDMLPSRILLYGETRQQEEVKQKLLGFSWQNPNKKLAFLHFPKIEVLEWDILVRALVHCVGGEFVKNVAMPDSEKNTPLKPESIATDSEPLEVSKPQDFGFVNHHDQMIEEEKPAPRTIFLKKEIATKKIMIGVAIILGLIGVSALFFYVTTYYPKAEIALVITPKVVQETIEVSVKPEYMESTLQNTGSQNSTGSKIIGDRALGQVTIYNATDTPKKFASGTNLTAIGGLKYVLISDVQIASASGNALSLVPGKQTVDIKASQVGDQYNLTAGTEFRIGSYALMDLVAKNDSALSGGTSRQTRAISKEDMTKIKTDVIAKIKEELKQKLSTEVDKTKLVALESITWQVIKENYSANIDDEVESFTYTASIKAKALILDKAHIQQMVDTKLATKTPQGYVYQSSDNLKFSIKKTEKDKITLEISASAQVLPQVDLVQAAIAVAGKHPDLSKQYFERFPGISQIDIVFTRSLPFFPPTLPKVVENIAIKTVLAKE